MSYLLDHYQMAGDPYHLGNTSAEQLALGYPITRGTVFPFSDGGALLLRRRLYPATGLWSYCGFARPSESTIANMAGFGHEPGAAFQYTVAGALGNGFISALAEPVRIDFDDAGDLITPALPMFPLGVVAQPRSGGQFLVAWTYDPFGQGDYPTDFQVFRGPAAGTVDYDTPLVDAITDLSTVPFDAHARRYTFMTAGYTDGVTCVFAVRARSSAGVVEQNTHTSVAKRAMAAGPAAADPVDLIMRRS